MGEVGPGAEVGGSLVFIADLLDFLRDHAEVSRRADGQFDFVAADMGELDFDVVADEDGFSLATLHHQHKDS